LAHALTEVIANDVAGAELVSAAMPGRLSPKGKISSSIGRPRELANSTDF